nr:BPK_HP1_G0044100.mRNA.1.CDS.1 [Saccharomyces cerevisiae]
MSETDISPVTNVRLNLSPQTPNSPHEGCKFYKIKGISNSDPRFKNKLVKLDSSDELLFLGTLDTIASISKILVTAIKDLLFSQATWENVGCEMNGKDIHQKNEVQQQPYSTF